MPECEMGNREGGEAHQTSKLMQTGEHKDVVK